MNSIACQQNCIKTTQTYFKLVNVNIQNTQALSLGVVYSVRKVYWLSKKMYI